MWTFRKSKESQASSTTCSKGCNVIKIPNCWSMLRFYSWNVTDELKQSVCIKHYSYWSSWLRQARATAFSILFLLLKGRINLQGESLDFHLFKWVEKKKITWAVDTHWNYFCALDENPKILPNSSTCSVFDSACQHPASNIPAGSMTEPLQLATKDTRWC